MGYSEINSCFSQKKIWPSLGEPPIAEKSYGKPNAMIIRGERIEIPNQAWRQVKISLLEWVIKHHPQDFAQLRQSVGVFEDCIEGKLYPRAWHQLSNGVWVKCNDSAKRQVKCCRQILATIGVSEAEWRLEEVK